MKKIVISGYYGFENAGDEAVLIGLKKSIIQASEPNGVVIEALSIAPERTTEFHKIPASHRMKIGSLLRSIASCDLFISGGGSLLQDTTSRYSIFYYLGLVRIAQILGKKTMFAAQGIGPLNLPMSRKLTASVANRLDWITVRDSHSAELLKEIGVTKPVIEVAADPALLLARSDFFSTHHDSPAERIGAASAAVALREWDDKTEPLIEALTRAWRYALPNAAPLAMPMHQGRDAQLCAKVASLLDDDNEQAADVSLPQLFRIASSARIVIGMRLHALIFAAAAGTPSVAISYDPKVDAFMEQTGQSDAVIPLEGFTEKMIAERLSLVWDDRWQRHERLMRLLPHLRELASLSAKRAIALLR
jgi:polysaccharide pyruvyl transferase CsaB